MKTVLLLRHAKSSWDAEHLPDYQRPLSERGERDAPRMGKALRKQGVLPDCILSSPATRTRQTLEAVLQAAHLEVTPQFVDSLYGASAEELQKQVCALPDTCSCVLMVGHNPGMEELVAQWTGEPEPMPTAALASIGFDVRRWSEIKGAQGKLAWRLTPKHLDDNDT
ncbi:MAG TPA: histidine phosphatase family protein [Chthonomonadaceae bacterium]|nr:histidine phosphatase family protein [Chthonomonadaceae bacterium]